MNTCMDIAVEYLSAQYVVLTSMEGKITSSLEKLD